MSDLELSLTKKKKIYHCCIANGKTIADTAKMLNIEYDIVQAYLDRLFSDPSEVIKVGYKKSNMYPKASELKNKFTGYFTETTEDNMLLKPHYSKAYIDRELMILPIIDRRSFTERYHYAMENGGDLQDKDSYYSIASVTIKKKNPVKPKFYIVDERNRYFCYNSYNGKALFVSPDKHGNIPAIVAVMKEKHANYKIKFLMEETSNHTNTPQQERRPKTFNDFIELKLIKKE